MSGLERTEILALFGEILGYTSDTKTYQLLDNYELTEPTLLYLEEGETFDGGHFHIRIDCEGYTGLFRSRGSDEHPVTIKDLIIESGTGTFDRQSGGGIVTSGQTDFVVKDCKVTLDLMGLSQGGICGSECQKFTIESTEFRGSLGLTAYLAGGMCGAQCHGFTLISCHSYGDLEGISCGGLVGGASYDFKVKSCENRGDLLGYISGGIVASTCYDFKVEESQNYGDLTGYVGGGIYGGFGSNFKIKDCINYGNMAEASMLWGGICGPFTGIIIDPLVGDETDYFSPNLPKSKYMKIKRCHNYGKVSGGNDSVEIDTMINAEISQFDPGELYDLHSGGICGPLFGMVGWPGQDSSLKIRIKDCINYGSQYSGTSLGTGIIGSLLAPILHSDQTTLTVADIKIEDCYSYHHELIGPYCLHNLSTHVNRSTLKVETSYTRDTVPVITSFGSNVWAKSSTYVRGSGKTVNLVENPIYVSHRPKPPS